MSQPDPPSPPPSAQELKSALKAFRKRLKLTRLDDESKLGGHGAMTGGRSSGVVGIVPPAEFPRAIWDELVRQGHLKYLGHGVYQLRQP